MEIPRGCTHVQLAREIDYDQRPTFMRWDFDFYSWGSCTSYYCWHIWHQGCWHKDYGYQKPKDPTRLITVTEYKTVYFLWNCDIIHLLTGDDYVKRI